MYFCVNYLGICIPQVRDILQLENFKSTFLKFPEIYSLYPADRILQLRKDVGCCHLVVCRTRHVFLVPTTKICENTHFCHQLIFFLDRKMQRSRRWNLNCVPRICRFCQNISEISLASGKNRLFSRNVLCYDVVISRIRCSQKHESSQKRS